jgi:hypothetical protein
VWAADTQKQTESNTTLLYYESFKRCRKTKMITALITYVKEDGLRKNKLEDC